MDNRKLVKIFQEIADILEILDDNPFRIRSYRRAVESIRSAPYEIKSQLREDPQRITELTGIGSATVKKLEELIDTGKCQEHQRLLERVPSSLLKLLELQSLGPRKIALLWTKLGVTTVDELQLAAEKNLVRALPGMGVKSEEKILRAIEEYKNRQGFFRVDHVQALSDHIVDWIATNASVQQIAFAGSLRRRKETVGDLDILVSAKNPAEVSRAFLQFPGIAEVLGSGSTRTSIRTSDGLQVDLRVIEDDSFGACLQYFTGSKEHNVALRERAKRLGFKINEYGLFRLENEERISGRTESEIYERLGLQFIPPELRENQGEIELALKRDLPLLITLDDIRGDLHVHTLDSDGRNTLEEMTAAAISLGYEYLAITDHSKALAMTGGLDEQRLLSQIDRIRSFNESETKIEILSGIEVDILADGKLDLEDNVLSAVDVVIASVHSHFNLTNKEMTLRICRALENPNVNILAHPTGRLLMKRPPFQVDLDEVYRTARENRVALEVNAHPSRLDLNDKNCRQARDQGLLLSVNSDSHSTEMFTYMSYGISSSRRGWIKAQDVINCYPLGKLRPVLSKQEYDQSES